VRVLLHPVLHLVLVLGAGLALAGIGAGTTAQAHNVASVPATPVLAGAGDGTADHDLFNPSTTLDTSRVDDLRTDPEAQCFAAEGVMTPAGACVDAIAVWETEVDPGVWAYLRRAGYGWSLDYETSGALLIPAEMVILHGADGDEVHSVDPARPLTPRA
jgi:hypothetical protein